MAGPLLGCCVCGSPVLCGVVGSVVTGPGPWTGCPPARPLALSFLSSSKELQLSGRHGLPALLCCCPGRTSASAKLQGSKGEAESTSVLVVQERHRYISTRLAKARGTHLTKLELTSPQWCSPARCPSACHVCLLSPWDVMGWDSKDQVGVGLEGDPGNSALQPAWDTWGPALPNEPYQGQVACDLRRSAPWERGPGTQKGGGERRVPAACRGVRGRAGCRHQRSAVCWLGDHGPGTSPL